MLHIDLSAASKIRNSLRDDLLSVRRDVAEAWRALQATLVDSHALMIEADRIMDWPTPSPISIFKPTWRDSSNWSTRAEELRRLAQGMKEIGNTNDHAQNSSRL
jgi:hypothetical protein